MGANSRFEWVDYAKGIGIFLVVYGHTSRGLVLSGIMPDTALFQYVDSIIYTFHMPLFFFLSGLFLASSFQSKGFSNVIGSKLDTILYPYILWSLLQGGIEAFLSSYTNGNVSMDRVLSLFTEPRAQFWFLYALFLVYFVSALALKIVGAGSLLFLFTLSVVLYIVSLGVNASLNINFITDNLVFFLMGAVFMRMDLIGLNNKYLMAIVIILALSGQYLYHYTGYTYNDKGFYLLLLSSISLIAVVYVSEWLSKFQLNSLAYVGASSMAIYLMHILAGSGSRILLSKVLEVDSLVLHLLVGVLLGIFAPLIALRIIDYYKIPYLFSFPIYKSIKRGG